MSIKLVDTLESMGNFPVANADGIQFTDGESLQKKLDDGSLGGGGSTAESYIELSEEEYFALSDEERASEVEYRTYDTGRIFKRGVEFGKETDISSKQDNLSQVKFTMRRNSASEGRYCLIGSSDLSQNLLMCEPYRFQGIFGDGTTSVENKSIIDFMVSFREGVGNPDEVLSGFANSSKGFEFVDLLITTDETTNMAYAYVDFKTSGSVATGEITKPVLEAESYMDFAESFELTDTYIGTLVCKMSDYAKIITNIDDETPSETSVWSSKKTSDEVAKVETELLANYSIPLNLYMGINHYLAIKINIHNMNYSFNMSDRSGNIYEGAFFSYNGSFSIQITKVNNSSTKNGYILGFRQYKVSDSEIYLVAKVSDYNYINGVINTPSILKSNIEILVNDDSTLWDKGTDIVVKELATMDRVDRYLNYETPIGTWIDGKPIYRKVVDCGALPNKDAKDVSHGIVNIDTVTNIYGIAIGGNISIPLPFADSASDGSVSAYRRGELIRITTATDRTSFTESYIIIEYTKTT